jgi:hypothetical protein
MKTTRQCERSEQLELGLEGAGGHPGPSVARLREARAEWWLAQLHRVVRDALDWRPSPAGRPHQDWLPRMSGERN